MPEKFVQIVITKKGDGVFHIIWQAEKTIIRSEYPDFVDAQAILIDALSDCAFVETPSIH